MAIFILGHVESSTEKQFYEILQGDGTKYKKHLSNSENKSGAIFYLHKKYRLATARGDKIKIS